MKKTILFWMGCLLALVPGFAAGIAGAAPAEASPTTLEYVTITPAAAPDDPKSIIKLLETMPGFGKAAWDAKGGAFTVAAEDSATFEPRALVTALQGEGIDVARLSLHFEEVHAKTENSMGIIYSPPNRLSFPAVFTWTGQRFWGFWGNNPRGRTGAFRMDLDVHLGAIGADGKAAPDSVEIIRFELTKPFFKGQGN